MVPCGRLSGLFVGTIAIRMRNVPKVRLKFQVFGDGQAV
jgi:hypothetical protein